MTDISYKLTEIRAKIEQLALDFERDPTSIELLAVSKGHNFTQLSKAYAAGHRHFGENYLQDALKKITQAQQANFDCIWHFIGQIQSNKTSAIAEHFAWCHSLSNIKHAKRLNHKRKDLDLDALNVCIQVQFESNHSEKENRRGGLQFSELNAFLKELKAYEYLKPRGLMCVLPNHWTEPEIENGYQRLQNVFLELKTKYPKFDTLSCGMSADYPQAIKYGSTMIRLGTAIFGSRIA